MFLSILQKTHRNPAARKMYLSAYFLEHNVGALPLGVFKGYPESDVIFLYFMDSVCIYIWSTDPVCDHAQFKNKQTNCNSIMWFTFNLQRKNNSKKLW
jgi:hypothetical protein